MRLILFIRQQKIRVIGYKPKIVFENIRLSSDRSLEGVAVSLLATAKNLTDAPQRTDGIILLDGRKFQNYAVELNGNGSQELRINLQIPAGKHSLKIGNSAEVPISVQPKKMLDLAKMPLYQYGSQRTKPFTLESDPKSNHFKIVASGSDFYHAEDSYATIYLKRIKGDFVATVQICNFGERTHEWFRSGLFVRNDLSSSFDVLPGSKGSVLLFGTPGRAGIQYDEFANGCMHKASSQNLPEHSKTPIYLKLVRHGNSFSGFISLDGTNWIIEKQTNDLPGLNESVDIGLAAGGPDTRQYTVEFKDWKIEVAK